MKKLNQIISAFLAVLMVLGAFASFLVVGVSAADEDAPVTGAALYITEKFNTPEDKFDSMANSYAYVENGFEIRVDPITGEVAVKEYATGNILFSNPYDVGNSKADDESESTEHLLSQVLINATGSTGEKIKLYSFSDAAMLGQISTSRIKNGIRVEYSIGEEATRKLVPYRITDIRYQQYILGPVEEAYEQGLITSDEYQFFTFGDGDDGLYFTKQSLSKLKESDHAEYLEKMPILATTDVWQIVPSLEKAILDQIEAVIKRVCPDYSFDMMDEDHAETGYRAIETAYPLFKMALEYTVTENGMTVRMPANGLRYNLESFTLDSVQLLPYAGAGHNANEGYTFFPDGSGAIYDFQQLKKDEVTTVGQPVYGIDYAYNSITEIRNQTPVRYPVYGVVANEKIYSYTYSYVDANTQQTIVVSDEASNTILSAREKDAIALGATDFKAELVDSYSRGFVAIVDGGDALANLSTYHAGSQSEYNTIIASFNPRPRDEYDLADSVSVQGDNTKLTVVSSRKYTGSINIQYKMLTDATRAAETKKNDPSYNAYDTSWFGMAEYYRDYLIANGMLTKLTEEDVEADIPLYIEVFGAMETKQTIMTLPVDVMTPLTTFDNIVAMFDELSKENVNNVNFKLTGFANGGIYSTVPSKLEWEDVVGGEEGFKKLVGIANNINKAEDDLHLGIYPDFDFAYISEDTMFDNTYLNDDAVKTINNRYTSKRIYSATQQKYITFYQLAVSPSRYDKFYTELMENYGAYDISSISVGSLGNALNSDFDEDEPFNREDSKSQTMEALNAIQNANKKHYSVMLDSANSYTWKYASHIINLDLDSSHHNSSAASVPFLGVILHGYVQFAGTPLNEESNIDYAILKALENGAGINFLLSYQNTTYLKEDLFLSQNYSVRYDIWKDDVVKYYNELNGLLKDVQLKEIVAHQFINSGADRVLTSSEITEQIMADLNASKNELLAETEKSEMEQIITLSDVRTMIYQILRDEGELKVAQDYLTQLRAANATLASEYNALQTAVNALPAIYNAKLAEMAIEGASKEDIQAAIDAVVAEINKIKGHAEAVMTASANVQKYADALEKAMGEIPTAEDFDAALALVNTTDLISAEVKQMYREELDEAQNHLNNRVASLTTGFASVIASYTANASYYDGSAASAEILATGVFATVLDIPADLACATDLRKAIEGAKFEKEAIAALGKYEPVAEEKKEAAEEQKTSTSTVNAFTVDNNSVVAVTYGDRVANENGAYESTAVKTFLLNYNTYAIRLEYNGILYTIPARGYVAVYH